MARISSDGVIVGVISCSSSAACFNTWSANMSTASSIRAQVPVAAGIVRRLLRREPGDERGPQVELRGFAHSRGREACLRLLDHLDRERVRLRRRLEVGNRALEQQLGPGRVLGAELHEHPRHRPQQRTRLVGPGRRGHPVEQHTVPLREHRVVDRVLRGEVPVQRRRPHPDLGGDVAQRQAGESLLARLLPGGLEDLGPGGFAPFGTSITSRGNYHGSNYLT